MSNFPTLNFTLGETVDMLRRRCQDFAAAEIAPRAAAIDRDNRFPRTCGARWATWVCSASPSRRSSAARHGLSRARRRDGGDQPRVGIGGPVVRRALQPVRQPDPPQRQRRAEAPVPAEARFRRARRRAGDERARLRVGRGVDAPSRRPARRSLRAERQQDVDHQRPRRRHAGRLCQDRRRCGPARHHRVPRREGHDGLFHRAKARQAGHARLEHLRAGVRGLRGARRKRARRGRPRRQRADERPRLRARGAGRRTAGHHAAPAWTRCCRTCTSAGSSASRSANFS